MRYRLNKLIYGPVGGVHMERLDRGSTWFGDELQVNYLRSDLTFTKTNISVLVEGTLETSVDVQCVRSLEFFPLPLSIPLQDIAFALPGNQQHRYDDEPLDDDFADRQISADNWLDLTETLREEIIMAIPISPVNPKFAGDNAPALPEELDEHDREWLNVKWSDKRQ